MSIEPFDWFNRFFGNRPFGRRNSLFYSKELDEMRREMEREFEENLRDIENKVPKDLIREYETQDGAKVREIGPLVYGSTTTIGPDGKPIVREFGNVKPRMSAGSRPNILTERQPLSEVSTTDKEVKVTVELPGVSKEQIKIDANENQVDIKTDDAKRRYHELIDLPAEVNIESVKSTFTNGLLEISFNKKSMDKAKSKSIRID